MHRFGRQCRGMGKVFVTLVRQTETHLLELGQPVLTLAQAAQACLHGTTQLAEDQRVRLDIQLTAALEGPSPDRTPIATADAGQSVVPRQDRQRRMIPPSPHLQGQEQLPRPVWPQARHDRRAERQASSLPCICPWAIRAMPAMWSPWSTTWRRRSAGSETRPTLAIHSLAGDLALNDATLREVLHERGILTVGIPKTIDPLPPSPTPEDVLPEPGRGGLARHPDPDPGAPRLRVWLQPTRGRKYHGQPAVSGSRAPYRQRPSRCDHPNGHGGHGPQCGHVGAHP